MSIPTLTFFSNKGGVGKTWLAYHLSWMFAQQGLRVLAVDLDPQASLSDAFLNEDRLASIWGDAGGVSTIFRSVRPLFDDGAMAPAYFQTIDPHLALLPGDIEILGLEDRLSSAWNEGATRPGESRSMQQLTAFWQSAQEAASRFGADLIVFDVAPSSGSINRAVLLGSSHVVVPLGGDQTSLLSLSNLGAKLRDWRAGWVDRKSLWRQPATPLPEGEMLPLGYVVMRHGVSLSRPVRARTRWMEQIPAEYRHSVLGLRDEPAPHIEDDPLCLAMLKNYSSLTPLGRDARKPIFALRTADGAIGSHGLAARAAFADFKQLAADIASRMGLDAIGQRERRVD